MKIAVASCMLEELGSIYETLEYGHKSANITTDLLICLAEFKATKENGRRSNPLWRYYSGEKVAPIATMFICKEGDSSDYLSQLYHGGYAAPNIFFLGFAGMMRFGSVRIGGLSGASGKYEVPYDSKNDVDKFMLVREPIDILLSYEWPLGIADFAEKKDLLSEKLMLRKEEGKLGNPDLANLMDKKPSYWFSADLQCYFPALVQHENGSLTKFLALNRFPEHTFLKPGPFELRFDEEWLAIIKGFHPKLTAPMFLRYNHSVIDKKREFVKKYLQKRGNRPPAFIQSSAVNYFSRRYLNRQTGAFVQFLESEDVKPESTLSTGTPVVYRKEDIDLPDSEDDAEEFK